MKLTTADYNRMAGQLKAMIEKIGDKKCTFGLLKAITKDDFKRYIEQMITERVNNEGTIKNSLLTI